MSGPVGWLRARMGVRVVSALSAAVVVAASLVVAGAALVLLVGQSLRHNAEGTAERRAQMIAERLERNFRGEANENAREALNVLTTGDDLAQVIVVYGTDPGETETRVIEAGTDAVGTAAPISDQWPDEDQTILRSDTPVTLADGTTVRAVLVATGTESEGRRVVLLFAQPLTAVQNATDTVLFYLLWGVPLLILVAGFATYLFAGRALRPVEAIRRQVAAMSEKDLAQRVPVPAAHDEVGRLAETMNGMIARLEDAQGVQRRFVADASHELRSPLATIATGLELMQNGAADRSTVGALRGETERLNRLVEALILLARADERGLRPRREEVDLDEVAEAERGRPAEGAVVAEVFAEPVRVIGDRGQLARVLRNLVDNGRRHARSSVRVTVRRDGESAVVEVLDDGPGIPAADRGRVFERFVRLDEHRARTDGGSGLGLAIVSEVVAAHGGTVEVTDGPSGGALFRVRLPAAPEPETPEPETTEPGGTESDTAEPTATAPRPRGRAVRPPAQGSGAPVDDGPAEPATGSGRNGAAPRPQPTPRSTGTQPTPPVAGTVPARPVPLRDEDARRDPVTSPAGIPVVPLPRNQPGSAIR